MTRRFYINLPANRFRYRVALRGGRRDRLRDAGSGLPRPPPSGPWMPIYGRPHSRDPKAWWRSPLHREEPPGEGLGGRRRLQLRRRRPEAPEGHLQRLEPWSRLRDRRSDRLRRRRRRAAPGAGSHPKATPNRPGGKQTGPPPPPPPVPVLTEEVRLL